VTRRVKNTRAAGRNGGSTVGVCVCRHCASAAPGSMLNASRRRLPAGQVNPRDLACLGGGRVMDGLVFPLQSPPVVCMRGCVCICLRIMCIYA
jgi:hypothetical protein